MKRLIDLKIFVALLAVFFLAGTVDTFAQTKKPVMKKKTTVTKKAGPKLYTVRAGTRMRVRMNETISSKTAKVGDTFTATVTEPVYSTNGVVVVPSGSNVVGRVTSAQKAVKGGKVGSIDVSFNKVNLPNGKSRAINGSLTELVSDDAKSDSEGTAKGDRTKHRKVIFIGGGGAGGAILGAAVGGGKGALIGGLIGAGAGFLGERFTKGEEAEVKSGTPFGVYLNQAASFPRFVEVNP